MQLIDIFVISGTIWVFLKNVRKNTSHCKVNKNLSTNQGAHKNRTLLRGKPKRETLKFKVPLFIWWCHEWNGTSHPCVLCAGSLWDCWPTPTYLGCLQIQGFVAPVPVLLPGLPHVRRHTLLWLMTAPSQLRLGPTSSPRPPTTTTHVLG